MCARVHTRAQARVWDTRVCLSRPVRARRPPRLAPSPDPGVPLARSTGPDLSASRTPPGGLRLAAPPPQGVSASAAPPGPGRGLVSRSVVPGSALALISRPLNVGVQGQGTVLPMLARGQALVVIESDSDHRTFWNPPDSLAR